MNDERDDFERLGPAGARDAALAATGRSVRRAEDVEDADYDVAPRGVGATLDLGLELVRSRFAVAVGLSSCLWLPVQAFNAYFAPDPEQIVGGKGADLALVFLTAGTSNLATGLMNLLTAALTARLLYDAFHGRRTPLGELVLSTLGRLPGLVVVGILSAIIYMVGFYTLFIGVFGAMWIVTPMAYVYVLERPPLGVAIQRSFQLSFDQLFSWPAFFGFWRWAGVMVVASLLSTPFAGLAAFSVTYEVRTAVLPYLPIGYDTYNLIAVVVGALFLGVATTVTAGILTAYYLDLRVRRDGLDLERWQRRLQDAAPVGSGVVGP